MAINSDTNRVALGLVEESVFGTTPASPAWVSQRITGTPNMAFEPQTEISEEIRSDRQITDLILVGAEAGGDVGMELSFDAQENVVEGALQNDWDVKAYRAGSAQITNVDAIGTQYDVTNVNDAFAVGMLVKASGFTDGSNNGTFRAETGSSSTQVERTGVANETPGATAKLVQVGFEGTSGDITATAGATNSLGSTTLDFTTMNLNPGEWLKVGGTAAGTKYDTAANNDWVRIAAGAGSITANQIVLDVVPSGWATDAGSGKTIRVWQGQSIINASVSKSYSLERQFTDHSPVTYEVFTGMKVNTLEWQFNAQSIVTSTVNYIGKNSAMSTTRTASSTDVAATTSEVMNTSSDVGRIGENGAPVGDPNFVLEASVNVNNNLRRQNAVGSLGSVGIGSGEFNVSGSLNTYFGNLTVAQKVIDNSESSFDIRVFDTANQAMIFDVPKLKFSAGSPSVPGKNQDVVVNLEYQGFRHPDFGYTLLIQRFYEFEA